MAVAGEVAAGRARPRAVAGSRPLLVHWAIQQAMEPGQTDGKQSPQFSHCALLTQPEIIQASFYPNLAIDIDLRKLPQAEHSISVFGAELGVQPAGFHQQDQLPHSSHLHP